MQLPLLVYPAAKAGSVGYLENSQPVSTQHARGNFTARMGAETQPRNQRRVRGWPGSFCAPCTRDRLAAAMRGHGRSPLGLPPGRGTTTKPATFSQTLRNFYALFTVPL